MQLDYDRDPKIGVAGGLPDPCNCHGTDTLVTLAASSGKKKVRWGVTIDPAIAEPGDILRLEFKTDLCTSPVVEYSLPEGFSSTFPELGVELSNLINAHPGINGAIEAIPGTGTDDFSLCSHKCPPCDFSLNLTTCAASCCDETSCKEQWATLTWEVVESINNFESCLYPGEVVVQDICNGHSLNGKQVSAPTGNDTEKFFGIVRYDACRENEHFDISDCKFTGGDKPRPYKAGEALTVRVSGDIYVCPVNPESACLCDGKDNRLHYATPLANGYRPGQVSVGPLQGFVPFPNPYSVKRVKDGLVHISFAEHYMYQEL